MSAILAIDGGGTHTRIGLYTAEGKLIAEDETEGSNLIEEESEDVARTIAEVGLMLARDNEVEIDTVTGGISGFGKLYEGDWFLECVLRFLGAARALVTTDIHALFHANCTKENPVLVIAGTGSSIIVRQPDGNPMLAGGLGPKLGDEGSAYCVALESIRAAEEDKVLLDALNRKTRRSNFNDIVGWLEFSRKDEIAQLSKVVLELAAQGHVAARTCLEKQIGLLAAQTVRAAEKAGLGDRQESAHRVVMVHGGMFENSPLYTSLFEQILQKTWPAVACLTPQKTGHEAAIELALSPTPLAYVTIITDPPSIDENEIAEIELMPTRPLDDMDSDQISSVMSNFDGMSQMAVLEESKNVAQAIDTAADCISVGGRIIYMGAGTSGRLGVLDASECPPTFGISENTVIGIIAGGDNALRHSIEGAEDDTDLAVRDLNSINPPISENDIVIGITASGTTPYVLAALEEASVAKAKTAIVCCNPVQLDIADIVISVENPPEVLPGSTRLTAGTATKMVLNQISTGAMAKAGYVFEGLMVGVRPVNKKLRARCIRIISKLTDRDLEASEKLLDETHGSIPTAVLMVRKDLSLDDARARLEAAGGILRKALEID